MDINTNFLCTYQLIENYEESFMLYKVQFLQIFNIDEYDDNLINSKVEKLYNKIKDNKIIKKLISNNNYYTDNLASFMLYFRYDTLYIFHKILNNILNNDNINENNNLYEEIIKIS
tara:strand:+ start:366 stop:713 length:348 start_codon:yes stop_codon:yes gene_type:complete